MFNTTCPMDAVPPKDPVPFISNGNINFKAHDVGWLVTVFFTLVATIASGWLIFKHLTYYTCPLQQRHIVRMLFMVPIYAIVSCASYIFYNEALYYQTIRDCYEAVVITSFFYLFLQYLGDTRAEQNAVFKDVKLKKWMWPMGWLRAKPKTGMGFLMVMKFCILQYAIVRPVCTLVAVGLEYFGLYCLNSFMPWFGHVWISVAISISVSVAMFCILQFYMPLRKELDPYKPVLKFLAVKSTVFLTFWQDTFLSLLVSFHVIKPSQYWTATEIQVGLNALLETFEMVLFAFLHIKAFTYLVYRPADKKRVTSRWRALGNVLDFRDWFFEMKDTTSYLKAKAQGRTYSYVEDVRAQKYQILQEALGRNRDDDLKRQIEKERLEMPTFWKEGCEKASSEPGSSDADVEKMAAAAEKSPKKGRDGPLEKLKALGPPDAFGEEEDSLLDYAARINKLDALLNLEGGGSSGKGKRQARPELTLFHRPPVFDGELGPADPQYEDDWKVNALWNDVYDHHQEDKKRSRYARPEEQDEAEGHTRERSWWRALRDRLSGSQGAEPIPDEVEESVPVLPKVDEAKSRALPDGFVPEPSKFAFESPLDMLMGTSSRGERPTLRGPGRAGVGSGFAEEPKAEQAPYFMPLAVSPAAMPVQMSTAAVDAKAVTMQRNESLATQSSKAASVSAYTSTTAPHAQQLPPSLLQSQQQSTATNSIRFADAKHPRDAQREEAAAAAAAKAAAYEKSTAAKGVAVGPKGKRINLVMPGTLSSAPLPPAAAPSSSQGPPPTVFLEAPRSQPRAPRQSLDSRLQQVATAHGPPASAPRPSHMSGVEQWRNSAAVVPPGMPLDQRQNSESKRRSSHGHGQGMQPRAQPTREQRNSISAAPAAPASESPRRKSRSSAPPAASVIPAPSQLLAPTGTEDPFTAGAQALAPPQQAEAKAIIAPRTNGPKHPHLSSVQADGGSAFAVGTIVTSSALAHVSAPAAYLPPQPMSAAQAYHAMPRGAMGPPRDAYAHPHIRTSRQVSLPLPSSQHSIPALPHVPPPRPRGSYDRYTGEPSRGSRQPRPRQGLLPPNTRPAGQWGHIEYI